MRSWVVAHSRAIAWVSCAIAVALALIYPILLYLDRNAGFESHGFPGVSEVG
jgi:hypothetical protein